MSCCKLQLPVQNMKLLQHFLFNCFIQIQSLRAISRLCKNFFKIRVWKIVAFYQRNAATENTYLVSFGLKNIFKNNRFGCKIHNGKPGKESVGFSCNRSKFFFWLLSVFAFFGCNVMKIGCQRFRNRFFYFGFPVLAFRCLQASVGFENGVEIV